MENIKIAVITPDQDYGRALGLALVDVYKNFTVTLYQSAPVHNELTGYDLILNDGAEGIGERIVGLVEKPSMTDQDYEQKRFLLYKYGNVRQLAAELLFIYSLLTGRRALPIRNRDVKLVVFCAAEGGMGCTSAAIAFARELTRFHGKKVLYISLEEMESTLEYMGAFPEGKSISEYLYYLFQEKERKQIPFIESFLVFDCYGVDSFLPSPGRNALRSLDSEEMQYFISAVMDTDRYDFLVIDAGSGMDNSILSCYEMADNICMVAESEKCSYKEERFLEYLIFLKGDKILERMGKLVNRVFCGGLKKEEDKKNEGQYQEILRIICRLELDPESFSEEKGVRLIAQDGAYGRGIKKLAESVLNNVIL